MAKTKERLSGKAYEDLIYRIYKELEPHATIKKNDKIRGIESGIDREIDISVRHKIAGHEILMVIQAKDHKRRADVTIVGEFDSVIRDVRASRGILICNAGFTKPAKEYAKNRGIDLYTVHDASVSDWQHEIKIPAIRTHLTIKYSFTAPIHITKEYKEKMEGKPQRLFMKVGLNGMILTRPDGTETSLLEEFLLLWSQNKISKQPGKHKTELSAQLQYITGWEHLDHQPTEFSYDVKARHYLKFLTPVDYRGIKDDLTERFKPTFMRFDGAVPFAEDKTWKFIEDPHSLSIDTVRIEVDVVDIDNVRLVRAEFCG